MNPSDVILLIVSLCGICLIFVAVYYFTGEKEIRKNQPDNANQNLRRKKKIGKEPVIAEEVAPVGENVPDANENDIRNEENGEDVNDEDGEAMTKKEWIKREKKKAKADAKAFEEANRDVRNEKQRKRDDAQREREMERENLEKQKEEEEAKLKEELEMKEKNEYDQWKDMFSLDASGSEDIDNQEKEDTLKKFLSYIKRRKVVVLEDLAMEFGLPAAQCVNRVTTLQETGELSGVIDDRGKFIYVSPEELQAVAKFVQRRGRIAITDLAVESNKLINLKEVPEENQEAGNDILILDDISTRVVDNTHQDVSAI